MIQDNAVQQAANVYVLLKLQAMGAALYNPLQNMMFTHFVEVNFAFCAFRFRSMLNNIENSICDSISSNAMLECGNTFIEPKETGNHNADI